MVTNIPELGVVSTHQKDDFTSQQHTFRPPCDTDDKGVHVYVHPEDGFRKHGEESEEEVMLHID